jgi:hypothetical protein
VPSVRAIFRNEDRSGTPVLAEVAAPISFKEEPELPGGVDIIDGVARDRLPDGVRWAQVIREYPNWMYKEVRFSDGTADRMWVTRRQHLRWRGKMLWQWFAVTRSREPGQEGGWVEWGGNARRGREF